MLSTTSNAAQADRLQSNATIILPGEGRRVTAGGGSCTFQVTSELSGGRIGIYEISVPPRTTGALPHYHRLMDELFLVRRGMLTVDLFPERREAPAGSVVYVPRLTPHAFSNTSDEELLLTLIFTPSENRDGYFEGLFALLNEPQLDMQRFVALNHAYDSYPVDAAQLSLHA